MRLYCTPIHAYTCACIAILCCLQDAGCVAIHALLCVCVAIHAPRHNHRAAALPKPLNLNLMLKQDQVGFCYVMAMLLSNSALFFINYPTQVIVKSCKMIPVMAVSVLVPVVVVVVVVVVLVVVGSLFHVYRVLPISLAPLIFTCPPYAPLSFPSPLLPFPPPSRFPSLAPSLTHSLTHALSLPACLPPSLVPHLSLCSSPQVRGKSYPLAAYVRVAMVTVGIICFTFFKKADKAVKGGRKNSIFGLSLALASLLMDGFVGPTQV